MKLDEVLGPDHAQTVMEVMSDHEAAQRAMREDLLAIGRRMDRRFEQVDARFEMADARFVALQGHLDCRFEAIESTILATVRGEMNAQTRALVLGLLGTFAANSGVVFTALIFS